MSYDPRTIAFLTELVYQPINLVARDVQTIHNALYREPELAYQNFQVAPDGIHLTNLADSPGAVSAVTFTPDRMVLREELRATTVEDFATRLVNVATLAFRTLQIPTALAQQFVIRTLVNPRHASDSREFLAQKLLATGADGLAPFGRPLQTIGLSFTFPQVDGHAGVSQLRIETWNEDPRSVWVENIGSYTHALQAENLPDLSNLLYTTYRFATGPAMEFLARFDTP